MTSLDGIKNSPIVVTKGPACMKMQTIFLHGPRTMHDQIRGLGRDVPGVIHASTSFTYPSVEAAREGFATHTNASFDRTRTPDLRTPYGRFGNPNTAELEARLLFSHGLNYDDNYGCVVFSTGMAAINAAILTVTKPGDIIIFDKDLYGCTGRFANKVLAKNHVRQSVLMDFGDNKSSYDDLRRAITPDTTAIYFETETNPHLKLNNIAKIARIAHDVNIAQNRDPSNKIRLIADNTFLGPMFCRPWQIAKNAVPEDPELLIVVESLTKIISGFGLEMGGGVLAPNGLIYDPNWEERGLIAHRDIAGAILSPSTAFHIAHYGFPTYIDREKTAEQIALRFAKYLETVMGKWVSIVTYPGLESYPQRDLAMEMIRDYDGNPSYGFMVGFNFYGNQETQERAATRYMDFIAQQGYAWNFAVSLGQVRSLTEVPAAMTHYGSGMPMFARNSIGTESPADIIDESEAAFKYAYN